MSNSNEAELVVWCEAARTQVKDYLKREGLVHGNVGDWPAWHAWPNVAIWAIESFRSPGKVGWWAISGDLPTDYISCGLERHPRQGLREIAKRWKLAVDSQAENRIAGGWSVGAPEDWPTLAPLLAARADLLLSYAADNELWND